MSRHEIPESLTRLLAIIDQPDLQPRKEAVQRLDTFMDDMNIPNHSPINQMAKM